MEYNKIELSEKELILFNEFKRGGVVHSNNPLIKPLIKLGLISHNYIVKENSNIVEKDADGYPSHDGYIMTLDGKRYIEYLKNRRKEQKITTRRYWVTTSIALIALGMALFDFIMYLTILSDLK